MGRCDEMLFGDVWRMFPSRWRTKRKVLACRRREACWLDGFVWRDPTWVMLPRSLFYVVVLLARQHMCVYIYICHPPPLKKKKETPWTHCAKDLHADASWFVKLLVLVNRVTVGEIAEDIAVFFCLFSRGFGLIVIHLDQSWVMAFYS